MENHRTTWGSRITRREFLGVAVSATAFSVAPRYALGGPGDPDVKDASWYEDIQSENLMGLVRGLQRSAVHDGPGIRTLVYMKGCPLRCLWCSSPETLKPYPEILHIKPNCNRCGRCVEACPRGLITLPEGEGIRIERELCTSCGQCVEACPQQALELVGDHMTVEELFREVDKDRPIYRRSDGGVTVGGGEATMQPEFVTAFLKKCQQHYIHTAIETCGYVKWEHWRRILEHLDLVYIDVKHMDPSVHRRLTGVPNELILGNVRRASAIRPTIIRTPIVPGYNGSDENVLATARFAAGLGENLLRYELLPYHEFGLPTYSQLGIEYGLAHVKPPGDDRMKKLKELVESCGVEAQIGG